MTDADGHASGNHFGEPGKRLSRTSAFYRGWWGAIGVLLAIGLAFAVRDLASVFILVFIAAFLAVGLNPIVELLGRRGVKRSWAVLIVAVIVVGVLALIVAVLISVLQNQVTSFINDGPHLLHKLLEHKWIRNLNDKYHFITSLQEKLKDPNLSSELLKDVFSSGLGALQAALSTVVVFVLTLYFLAALPQLKRGMYSLAPASRRLTGRTTRRRDPAPHRPVRRRRGTCRPSRRNRHRSSFCSSWA